jgi:hypothetical protein
VARLRKASRNLPRFVADDKQSASSSRYEEEVQECVGRIVDQPVLRNHGLASARGKWRAGVSQSEG